MKVSVKAGMVTLTAAPDAPLPAAEIASAKELIWDIDGVVDVLSHLASPQPA